MFLDKTWAKAHDGKVCARTEKDAATGGTLGGVRYCLKCPYKFLYSQELLSHWRPTEKGTWLIILRAGGENGWVPNTIHTSLQTKHQLLPGQNDC